MSNPPRERASLGVSAPLRVGAPTSSAVLRRWSDAIQCLAGMGAVVGTVGTRLYYPASTPSTTRVTYRRSPWARYVAMAYVMPERPSTTSLSGALTVTFPGAVYVDVPGEVNLSPGAVDVQLRQPAPDLSTHYAYWDVSGLTPGALVDFVLLTNTKSVPCWGQVFELPLGILDPDGHPTRDPAYAAASSVDGRVILSGDLSTPDGTGRLWALLEQLRTGRHDHLNWCQPEETQSVGSVAAPSYAQWIVRPRRMVAGAAVPYKLRVRYLTASGIDGTLHMVQRDGTSSGTSGLTTTDFTLPASTSWTNLDLTLDTLATSTELQQLRWGWDNAAVAHVALIS